MFFALWLGLDFVNTHQLPEEHTVAYYSFWRSLHSLKKRAHRCILSLKAEKFHYLKKIGNSYRKNEGFSRWKAHTNIWKLNWNVLMVTDVFINQKRATLCELRNKIRVTPNFTILGHMSFISTSSHWSFYWWFADSNPAEVDGFLFQDVKILSTSPPGGTLSWGSWVWDFRLVKEPQAWKNRPLSKI